MKKRLLMFVAVGILAMGCDSLPTKATDEGSVIKTVKKTDGSTEVIENLSDYAIYARHAGEKTPIFKMSCPDAGCVLKSLEVNAPDNGAKLSGPPETLGQTAVKGFFGWGNNILDKAAGAVPFYFGAKVLTKAFDKANSSVTTTTTNVDDHSNRSQTDNSNRSTNIDGSNRSTNIDNSNRSTNNSNNRNCQTGAPSGTTGQSGSSGPATC